MSIGRASRRRGPVFAGATAVLVALSGCAWGGSPYNVPPAASEGVGPVARDPSRQRVVVLGHFQTPAHPLQWPNVGPGMSDALARTLLNHGNFDVWINPNLARRVEALVDTTPEDRVRQLGEIRAAFPEVRLVVTGRVTDFHHTVDVTRRDAGRSLFSKRREAFVAIQLNVFDLDLGRVVATDHVCGTAPAPETPSEEVYAGVEFDSYLFWSTPLGEASELAIDEAMAVLNRVVPTRDESLRIVQQMDGRRVRIAGGSGADLREDRRYYVYRYDEERDVLVPVLDRHTRQPLQAMIGSSSRIGSTAWLLGETPDGVDLRGAVLSDLVPAGRFGLARDQPSPAATPSPPAGASEPQRSAAGGESD